MLYLYAIYEEEYNPKYIKGVTKNSFLLKIWLTIEVLKI